MLYFSQHPTVNYDLFRDGRTNRVTNITSRISLSHLTAGLGLIYFDYLVKENERPDIIAYKYYSDERYDWVVYLANQIHDPYFQWVMSAPVFNTFILDTYESLSYAQQTIHHYEWLRDVQHITTQPSGESIMVPSRTHIIDYATYLTLPSSSRRSVTIYDYEDQRNESRRRIKLIDQKFMGVIEQQFHRFYPNV